jgi:hypothetical protein
MMQATIRILAEVEKNSAYSLEKFLYLFIYKIKFAIVKIHRKGLYQSRSVFSEFSTLL